MPGMTLLNSIKRYLSVDGSEDDMLLASLISAAKQYLLNAGVREPDEEADDGKLSLYELAVSLYVSLVYDGDDKGKIDRAMTAIILQIKDYGGGEESA
ncbi:MAG: phage gp6-like head-tail connector protein [Clostridiales bacterium]|nr:phage gp6-like head-tail connector protein [Clostridiales bacterium]